MCKRAEAKDAKGIADSKTLDRDEVTEYIKKTSLKDEKNAS